MRTFITRMCSLPVRTMSSSAAAACVLEQLVDLQGPRWMFGALWTVDWF